MDTAAELILKQSKNHAPVVNKILEPLTQVSGITVICRFTISKKGALTLLSNRPELNEAFYGDGYYRKEPLFCFPDYIKEGYYLPNVIQSAQVDEYCEIRKNEFGVDHYLLMVHKTVDGIEVFGFATEASNSQVLNFYLNERKMLESFIGHFKESLKREIAYLHHDPIDLLSAKGEKFYQDPKIQAGVSQEKKVEFFSQFTPIEGWMKHAHITPREKDVINLLKEGKTAKKIGEELYLCSRTIEYYINNLKDKLECNKKGEIVEKILQLEAHGLF